MPTLHLQVCAGFANRLRALISGLCFAEDYRLKLVIHWFPMSPECACRFQSVLDPESLPKTVKIVTDDLYMANEVLSQEDVKKAYATWDETSDLNWKSYGIFYTNANWTTHLRALRPSRFVKELLDRRCAQLDWTNTIGVHIRRGDNKKSIEGSPLENFLQKMRSNSDAVYVVATDDQNVREELTLEFGGRCVFPAGVLSRKTEDGMVNGVADFFALAKTTEIWGSYWSSFSDIAARYGSVHLTIA
jgi:hypothetical protein